jgi:hypothetical protein
MVWTKEQVKLARKRFRERLRAERTKRRGQFFRMLFQLCITYVLLKSRILCQLLFDVLYLYLRYTICCFLVVYFVRVKEL